VCCNGSQAILRKWCFNDVRVRVSSLVIADKRILWYNVLMVISQESDPLHSIEVALSIMASTSAFEAAKIGSNPIGRY
jgi:hypothetical protein